MSVTNNCMPFIKNSKQLINIFSRESNSAEPEISREPSRTNTVEHRTPEPRLSLDDSKEEEMVSFEK